MVILPGITTSWTQNLPGMVVPLGITSSRTKKICWKNGYSARNNPLRDEESTGGLEFRRFQLRIWFSSMAYCKCAAMYSIKKQCFALTDD
jgi:hypothetical protein